MTPSLLDLCAAWRESGVRVRSARVLRDGRWKVVVEPGPVPGLWAVYGPPPGWSIQPTRARWALYRRPL